jgi:dTDP-4-dehydrorhamnose reductase
MLGACLSGAPRPAGIELYGLDHRALDITDPAGVERALAQCTAGLVINAAAFTGVDAAEGSPEVAARVNRDGVAVLAQACKQRGIPLIHVSTDYVFDGRARTPYHPDHPAAPINAYGRSKWEGEEAIRASGVRHLIIRTAWLYDMVGHNFLRSILRLATERDELRVVTDQTGTPTAARDLAAAILSVAAQILQRDGAWGTHHFTNAGQTTWFGFAEAILAAQAGPNRLRAHRVTPITTADYPTPARRPAYSVLDTSGFTKAFGIQPRPWELALKEVLHGSLA